MLSLQDAAFVGVVGTAEDTLWYNYLTTGDPPSATNAFTADRKKIGMTVDAGADGIGKKTSTLTIRLAKMSGAEGNCYCEVEPSGATSNYTSDTLDVSTLTTSTTYTDHTFTFDSDHKLEASDRIYLSYPDSDDSPNVLFLGRLASAVTNYQYENYISGSWANTTGGFAVNIVG